MKWPDEIDHQERLITGLINAELNLPEKDRWLQLDTAVQYLQEVARGFAFEILVDGVPPGKVPHSLLLWALLVSGGVIELKRTEGNNGRPHADILRDLKIRSVVSELKEKYGTNQEDAWHLIAKVTPKLTEDGVKKAVSRAREQSGTWFGVMVANGLQDWGETIP